MCRGIASFSAHWGRVSYAPAATRLFTEGPGAGAVFPSVESTLSPSTRPCDEFCKLGGSCAPPAELVQNCIGGTVHPLSQCSPFPEASAHGTPHHRGNSSSFSAANFFKCSANQWLALVESLAKSVNKRRCVSDEEPTADSGSLSQSGVGGLPGWELPTPLLLWRVRRHLLQLDTRSMVRGCIALQRLNLREGPSHAGVQKDLAMEFLLLLDRRLSRNPRALSLGLAAAAGNTLSEWRFAGEDCRAALYQQQLHADRKNTKAVDPIALRTQVFRRLLASTFALLQESRAQRRVLNSAIQALSLLRACAKLQITELRYCYLLILQQIEAAVSKTPSLLQLALLLHCCTRLLLVDTPVYRLVLERLANSDTFHKLLQSENQVKAAQVALGQLALACVAFSPDQLTALDSEYPLNEDVSGVRAKLPLPDGSLSLPTLHDRVLLNVLYSSALCLAIPGHAKSPRLSRCPSSTHSLGHPSAFLWKQLQIAILAICCERTELRNALSLPTVIEAAKNRSAIQAFSSSVGLAVSDNLTSFKNSAEVDSDLLAVKPQSYMAADKQALRQLLLRLLESTRDVFPGCMSSDKTLRASSSGMLQRPRQGSELHHQVVESFKTLGLQVREEVPLGPYDADVVLHQQMLLNHPCIIEIDGPLHFVRPPLKRHLQTDLSAVGAAAEGALQRSLRSETLLPNAFDSAGDAVPVALKKLPRDNRIFCDPGKRSALDTTCEPFIKCGWSQGLWSGYTSKDKCLIYDVKSALKHRLLCSTGWRVLHISWNDWPQNSHNRVRAIGELLRREFCHNLSDKNLEYHVENRTAESSVFDDEDEIMFRTEVECSSAHKSEPGEELEVSEKPGEVPIQSCDTSSEPEQALRPGSVFWGGTGNCLLHYKPQFRELLAAEVETQ